MDRYALEDIHRKKRNTTFKRVFRIKFQLIMMKQFYSPYHWTAVVYSMAFMMFDIFPLFSKYMKEMLLNQKTYFFIDHRILNFQKVGLLSVPVCLWNQNVWDKSVLEISLGIFVFYIFSILAKWQKCAKICRGKLAKKERRQGKNSKWKGRETPKVSIVNRFW